MTVAAHLKLGCSISSAYKHSQVCYIRCLTRWTTLLLVEYLFSTLFFIKIRIVSRLIAKNRSKKKRDRANFLLQKFI